MGGAISKTKRLTLEERVQFIKGTPFFLYLEDSTLKEFAKCFSRIDSVKKGERLSLNENLVYIIATGDLELSTTMADPKMKIEHKGYLCKKHPGDIISKPKEQGLATKEVSGLCCFTIPLGPCLNTRNSPQLNEILQLNPKTKKMERFVEQVETWASKDSLLLCSDESALNSFLAAHPDLSTTFNAIIGSHIETYLSKIPFLQGLKASKLTVLATMCRYEALDANSVVFEENTPGDKLYILLSGKATVLAPKWIGNATVLQQSLEWGSQNEKNDYDVIVAGLKSGDYFGETALFVNINRTSTIRTTEKSLFVTVGKRTFENFCAVCPEIKEKMQIVMKARMVSKLSSLGIPFLNGIPPASMQMLTNHVEVHETQQDEVIFNEGDAGDRFYIIVHGEVKVEKREGTEDADQDQRSFSDTRSLGILIAGNYFGEMGKYIL